MIPTDAANAFQKSSYDVLKKHHVKNGCPHAPDNDYLHTLPQGKLPHKPNKDKGPSMVKQKPAKPPADYDGNNHEHGKGRAPKYSKNSKDTLELNPTKLSFYKLHWQGLLRYAKSEMHLHCATMHPFVPLETVLDGIVREILSQALVKWREEERGLEEGKPIIMLVVDRSSFVVPQVYIACTNLTCAALLPTKH